MEEIPEHRKADENSASLVLLNSHEERLARLEQEKDKSWVEDVAKNGSVAALFLGLVLSILSVYEVVVQKPDATRIAQIAQFNDAVNAAAKVQLDAIQVRLQTSDPQLRYAMGAYSIPQILSHVSTAKAVLRDMKEEDVEIPQLIILTDAALIAGDLRSAAQFTDAAVRKVDVSPYLQSEARRYQAKVLFLGKRFAEAREALNQAVMMHGTDPAAAGPRAFLLSDWMLQEYMAGECSAGAALFTRFAEEINRPSVPTEAKSQLVSTVKAQLAQMQQCPPPPGLEAALGM